MVESKLHQQVRETAMAAGVDVAPWLRYLVRRVTRADFPASWREGVQRIPAIHASGRTAKRRCPAPEPDDARRARGSLG